MLSRCELKQLLRRPRHVLPRAARRSERRPLSARLTTQARVMTLLPYPLLHESNYFDHEASGRKHARMLSNRVAREATWIDAVGQHEMNRQFRDGDSKRKRNNITRRNGTVVTVRHVIDNVGHRLAGMPDDPPPSVATAAGPTLLVPDEDQRWSFEFKDASEGDIEHELAALQVAVDAKYSAPAVMSRETVLLSPPSGTFARLVPSRSLPQSERHPVVSEHLSFLSRTTPRLVGTSQQTSPVGSFVERHSGSTASTRTVSTLLSFLNRTLLD